MEELRSSQNAEETASSSQFIHDLNSVLAQTNPELMLIKQKRGSLEGERENGSIQERLEGNVRLQERVIRKTLAKFDTSKKMRVLKEQTGKIRRQEDLV